MAFKLFYFIFLIVSLFYPTNMAFGPLSIRHILSIIVLALCVYEDGLKIDKFLKWYFGFLFFYTFIEVATGYSSIVFPKLLGTYLASISLYLATKIMIEKHESGTLIIYTLVALGLLNAIEVIGQFFGSPIAQALPQLLHIQISEEDLAQFEKNDFYGYNIGGLMGAVSSGYFLSATSVLALYNQKDKISVFNWIVFAIIFLALFLVQERSGLFFGLLCALLYYAFISSQNQKALFSSIFIFILAAIFISRYLSSHISFEDMRYSSTGIDDERRVRIAIDAIKWLFSYPAGGANYFYKMGGLYPHNVIINAFLYGGIIGGCILIGILFKQLFKIGDIMYSFYKKEKYSSLLLACCVAYLCYTFNSFFHNYSLVFGGETIFLLWAMIGSLKDMKDNSSEDIDLEEETDAD